MLILEQPHQGILRTCQTSGRQSNRGIGGTDVAGKVQAVRPAAIGVLPCEQPTNGILSNSGEIVGAAQGNNGPAGSLDRSLLAVCGGTPRT